MAITESGVDYFRSSGLLTLGGQANQLTVAQLGLLNGHAAGTRSTINLGSTSGDDNLNVGEAFSISRVTTPLIGAPTTENLNLTMVGSGTFTSLGSVFTGTADVIIGQDQNGAQYVVFPDGNMPSGLLGAVVGAVATTLDLDPVGYNFTTNAALCFARDTMIETAQGPRAIQDLQAGDLVATKDNGMQPIRWIASRTISGKTLAQKETLRPVLIRAGSLGDDLPAADLIVSPQHRVLVRSRIAQKMFGAHEVLVAAKQLVQLPGIDFCENLDGVEYFHMLFDQHEVVFANGAEAESLYTGPQALRTVGKAALEEIFQIFPELQDADYQAQGVRIMASGRQGRKLVQRHMQHGKALVANA